LTIKAFNSLRAYLFSLRLCENRSLWFLAKAQRKEKLKLAKKKSFMKQGMSSFARRLLSEWKRLRLPLVEEHVVVAVSGGADSVALLLALDELLRAQKLSLHVTVAHLNHGLRGEAGAADARWVSELARSLDYEIALGNLDVRELARERRDNLEQAARRARYSFLSGAAQERGAQAVLTAHTMDDQAETVLLRLMRGSGVDGLGGIEPVRVLDREKNILLVRPLLRWAGRAQTEDYCRARGMDFRVDEMNADETFARVRVRKQLLPLMQTFNGRIIETLSRTAGLLREDASALRLAADELLKAASDESIDTLNVKALASAESSVRRRALRQWLARMRGDTRRLELVHLMEVEKLVFGERGGRIAELPGGSRVERRRGQLYFHVEKEDSGV
jgi:tRNA(Ile)-lysidine synthase